MSKEKSKGHAVFIGEHEYFIRDGALYRATVKEPIGNDGRRVGRLWVGAPHGETGLRFIRLAAGLPEK